MEEEFEIYAGFASVYDEFMDNIPYDEWHEYLRELLKTNNIDNGIVVDLACGTGTMTSMLAEDGYDMIGIDMSEEMLDVARQKCSSDILLLQQDMRELDLYGSAAAIVCVCDGMNYIIKDDELLDVFNRVKMFLDYGGLFVFDLKTEHFYRDILGNRTIAENREDASFIWENEYCSDTGINEYLLTIYSLADEDEDLFERNEEIHHQRAYQLTKVKELLAEAGLECVSVYNAFTKEMPDEDSERIYVVARRPQDN